MEVAFYLGTFAIHWYGILITLAAIAAVSVSSIEAKRRGQSTEHIFNLALIVIPLGAIGARLYHVIDLWEFYSQNPALIFGGQGLGIFGAIIGGAIGLIIYTKWKGLGTLRWLDITAPGLMLAQAVGRWGNFFNQELYGYPTDLPWAVYIDLNHRLPGYEPFSHFHPLFLYESLWNFVGFSILMILGRKLKNRLLDGEIFLLYAIYYSVGRFVLEGFKIDVWMIAGVPTARWVTTTAIIISIAILIYRRYRMRHIASNTT